MTALPQLLKAKPDLKVIMASTLTEKSAAISLKALSLGAADYIPKPSAAREVHGAATFRDDLLEKVIGLASVGRVGKSQPPASDEPVRDGRQLSRVYILTQRRLPFGRRQTCR